VVSVLLDTGPLVALFKRADKHHSRSVAWFKAQRGPLLTTQPVITEAWHLLAESARLPLVRFVTAACDIMAGVDHGRVLAVLEKYRELRLDYADATLVVLAEDRGVRAIATIDVKDFSACRLSNGRSLRLVF
jgi:uncharacterized protein